MNYHFPLNFHEVPDCGRMYQYMCHLSRASACTSALQKERLGGLCCGAFVRQPHLLFAEHIRCPLLLLMVWMWKLTWNLKPPGLKDDFPFQISNFQVPAVSLQGCISNIFWGKMISEFINKYPKHHEIWKKLVVWRSKRRLQKTKKVIHAPWFLGLPKLIKTAST